MNILDKAKSYFQNFDANNALGSIMATVASISTENILSMVYLLIAMATFWHNMMVAKARLKLELEKESLLIRKEQLNNDRYEIETNKIKINSNVEIKN